MTIVASNNITVSNVNDGTITHYAWAYSADGTDRFTTTYPNLNLLVNSSAKTKAGFFKNFDKVENDYGEVTMKGTNNYVSKGLSEGFSMQPRDYKPGDKYTMSMEIMFTSWNLPVGTTLTEFWIGQRYSKSTDGSISSYKQICSIDLPRDPSNMLNQWIRITKTSTIPPYEDPSVNTEALFMTKFTGASEGSYTVRVRKPKQEPGSIATPWMPSSSEVATADWPSYIGQYSDFTSTVSTDPAKYSPWTIFKGNDGVGIKTTDITYAISTSGTTAPSTGWTSSIPSPVKGQYLWTKTVWTYTDTSSKTGYSVTYISKDGIDGTDGTSGVIVSSVAPTSPQNGQLWQDTSTTPQLVKKWTGSSWVIWELYAQNLKADSLETVSAKIGKIYNEFDNSSGGIDNKGTITIEDSVKVVYYLGNSSTTIDLVTSSSGQGLFTQHLPDKTDTSKFKQSWYMPTGLYFNDSINNWTGQITAENVTLVPWTNLTYLSGYTTAENNPCQYRKIKNLDGSYTVQFRGQVKPTSGNFPTTDFQSIAVLPTDIRPPKNSFANGVGDVTGTQTIRIGVFIDGGVQIGVRGTATSYVAINSLTYII